LDDGNRGESFPFDTVSVGGISLSSGDVDSAAISGTSSNTDTAVVKDTAGDAMSGAVTLLGIIGMGAGPAVKEVDTGAATNPFSKFTTSTGLMSAAGSRSFILMSSSEQDHLRNITSLKANDMNSYGWKPVSNWWEVSRDGTHRHLRKLARFFQKLGRINARNQLTEFLLDGLHYNMPRSQTRIQHRILNSVEVPVAETSTSPTTNKMTLSGR